MKTSLKWGWYFGLSLLMVVLCNRYNHWLLLHCRIKRSIPIQRVTDSLFPQYSFMRYFSSTSKWYRWRRHLTRSGPSVGSSLQEDGKCSSSYQTDLKRRCKQVNEYCHWLPTIYCFFFSTFRDFLGWAKPGNTDIFPRDCCPSVLPLTVTFNWLKISFQKHFNKRWGQNLG